MPINNLILPCFSTVTSKLGALSTNIDDQKEHSVKAFVEVLHCNQEHANFYLESAGWNIEVAIALWLENNNQRQDTAINYSFPKQQWKARDVIIEGFVVHF